MFLRQILWIVLIHLIIGELALLLFHRLMDHRTALKVCLDQNELVAVKKLIYFFGSSNALSITARMIKSSKVGTGS